MKQITQVGGFTWDLFFDWKELPQEQKDKRTDVTEPLKYYLQAFIVSISLKLLLAECPVEISIFP